MTEQEFKDSLRKFCVERGWEISGTCELEGIYGEITVARVGEDNGWRDWPEHTFNWSK